jgi:hypothetical protein
MDLRTALTQPFTLPLRLRRFLKDGGGLDRVPDDLRVAIATRASRFLDIVERHVYGRPRNPYRKLLTHAGCELGDLRILVSREGLEAALRTLAREGVYLSTTEIKGKVPVERSTVTFTLAPDDLRLAAAGFHSHSSGTSNRPQQGTSSFDWMARQATAAGAFVLAHRLESHRHSAYEPILPGVAGVMYMVMLARLGIPCERWFARAIPFRSRLEHAYCLVTARELSFVGTRFGPGFGAPETVSDDRLDAIVGWIAGSRAEGRPTCVRTVASNSARIAREALRLGTSLEGVTFLSSGEPMTEAKRKVIEEAGGRTTVMYGFDPGSVWVAQGCPNRMHTDEMHVSLNTLAAIERPDPAPLGGEQVHPLLYTTLYESAGRLLINAESGDFARLEERDCGCVMQQLGLTLHIHHVRSYEKLTSEGLNYPVDDLTEIIESRLPAAFGGGPCDYQLIEEEASDGRSRLTLRVHPAVGPIDEARVLERLTEELGRAGRAQSFMTGVWRDAGTLSIERKPPRASPRGKTLPVHFAIGRES